MIYPEGSFFDMLFRQFPDTSILVTSTGICASWGGGDLVFLEGERPDGRLGELWDWVQGIRDLM